MARLAGGHFRRGNHQTDRRGRSDSLEIDGLFQQGAQRVKPQRIELIRRHQACNLAKRRPRQTEKKWIEPQKVGYAGLVDGLQTSLSFSRARSRPTLGKSCRQGHRIDGTGAGSRNPAEFQPFLFEKAVEHTPGEGTMCTSALKREIEPQRPMKKAH